MIKNIYISSILTGSIFPTIYWELKVDPDIEVYLLMKRRHSSPQEGLAVILSAYSGVKTSN